jgi:folate-dependent phosphoribosylglycinamide formyltransferase PurN
MAISIVIITGDQLRHHYFVDRLNADFDLRGVVSEAVFQPKVEGTSEEIQDLRKHFQERENAERQYFSGHKTLAIGADKLLRVAKGEANSDQVYEWITERTPDYLVLYGSSIIRERLLKAFEGRVINMHLGLSPYYRGSGTNFWPLVNGEPELVGTTIHLATLDVDAGAILKQVRPEIVAGDRNHDIGCKAIIAGAEAMIRALNAYDQKQITPQPQAPSGKLYRRKDFNVEVVRDMWRNLDQGMVESYLADPTRVDRYPIVE